MIFALSVPSCSATISITFASISCSVTGTPPVLPQHPSGTPSGLARDPRIPREPPPRTTDHNPEARTRDRAIGREDPMIRPAPRPANPSPSDHPAAPPTPIHPPTRVRGRNRPRALGVLGPVHLPGARAAGVTTRTTGRASPETSNSRLPRANGLPMTDLPAGRSPPCGRQPRTLSPRRTFSPRLRAVRRPTPPESPGLGAERP